MPGPELSISQALSHLLLEQIFGDRGQIRKQSHREVKQVVQGHTASKEWSWDSKLVSVGPESVLNPPWVL